MNLFSLSLSLSHSLPLSVHFLWVTCRVRLVSLAAQKFVSDIVNDSLQYCKMRGSGQSSRKSGRTVSESLILLYE